VRAGATRVRAPLNVMPRGTRVPPLGPSSRPAPLMLAAGDIACRPAASEVADACHQDATGLMVAGSRPEVVAALGDVQYERGAADEFSSYDASWGFALPRTRPAVGNHEYKTPGAAPYYRYFGAFAGQPGRGYYSYEVGTWHVVVLNSNCNVVGCAPGSLQERWLRADLAARPAACTVAYAHHPRFSSGTWQASNESLTALFDALYDYRVDLFLAGHDHIYERIAPVNPSGDVEYERGVRPFVVGTGGRGFSAYRARATGRESTQAFAFGVLLLSLKPRAYSWYFAAERPQAFRDSGFDNCR
jgi:3',5'-cyclic AMP phosphodiesterase CpdA